jgi:hypothetical protein
VLDALTEEPWHW